MADIYGVYRGEVANTDDPEQRGRLQLRIPQVLGTSISAWAEPSDPPANLPDVGEWVWVQFTGGDATKPVYVSYGGGKLIDQLDILNRPPTLQANSPVPGSFSWGEFKIRRNGVDITIEAGSSSARFVYWTYADGAFTIHEEPELPTDLTADDYLAFVNTNGVALDVNNTQVIDGSLLIPETVRATAIAAIDIAGESIVAGQTSAGNSYVVLDKDGLRLVNNVDGTPETVVNLSTIAGSGTFTGTITGSTIQGSSIYVDQDPLVGNSYTRLAQGAIELYRGDRFSLLTPSVRVGTIEVEDFYNLDKYIVSFWGPRPDFGFVAARPPTISFQTDDDFLNTFTNLTGDHIHLSAGQSGTAEIRLDVDELTIDASNSVTIQGQSAGDTTIDSPLTVSGAVTLDGTLSVPNKPRSRVYLGTNYTIPDTAINYPALTQGLLTGVISLVSGQVQIDEAGVYLLSGQARFNGTAGTTPITTTIRVNAGVVAASYGVLSSANVTVGISAMPIALNVGDTVSLGFQGASGITVIGSAIATYLSVVLDS